MALSQQAGVWEVTDQTSSNGTFVNGARVSEAQLFSGDEIRAGRTQFNVVIRKGTSERATPPPASLPESANVDWAEAGLDQVTAGSIHASAHTSAGDHAPRQTPESSNRQTTQASLRRLSDGQEFSLAPNQLVSLGRSPESQISLASDFEVSTQHATLMFDGSCIQLRDVGSFNGTFVGSIRITTTELAHGDRLRVGKTEFVVCLPQADERDPSPAMQPLHTKPSAAVAPDFPYYSSHSDADFTPQASGSGAEFLEAERSTHESPMPSDSPPSVLPPEDIAAPDSESSPMWPDSPTSDSPLAPPPVESIADGEPDLQMQVDEQPLPPEPSRIVSASHPIDLNVRSYAGQAAALEAVACPSGLFVYLGEAATLQPVDVCLNLLHATSGWVLNGSEIENWIQAAIQGLSGQPREWLNPSQADDASWMLPFLDSWGSGNSWLVLSHVDLDDGLQSLRNLRQSSEGGQPLLTSLTPTSLADFLTGQDNSVVEPFFAPFDAILLEVGAGERWALVGRQELEAILKSSNM